MLCPQEKDWMAFRCGDMASDEADAFLQHLETCSSCRREADAYDQLERALSERPLKTLSAAENRAIARSVQISLDREMGPAGRSWSWLPSVQPAVSWALPVLIFGLGLMVGRSWHPGNPEVGGPVVVEMALDQYWSGAEAALMSWSGDFGEKVGLKASRQLNEEIQKLLMLTRQKRACTSERGQRRLLLEIEWVLENVTELSQVAPEKAYEELRQQMQVQRLLERVRHVQHSQMPGGDYAPTS